MDANKAAVPVTQAEVMDAAIAEARAWWTAHEGHHDLSNMTAEELYGIATAAHFAGIQWILGGPWYGNAAPAYQSRYGLKNNKLRDVNAELVKALQRLAETCGAPNFICNAPTLIADDLEFASNALAKAGA